MSLSADGEGPLHRGVLSARIGVLLAQSISQLRYPPLALTAVRTLTAAEEAQQLFLNVTVQHLTRNTESSGWSLCI